MLISRDQVIAGIGAVDARSLMQRIRECAASTGFVAEHLDLGMGETVEVLDRLVDGGFVREVDRLSQGGLLLARDEAWERGAPGQWWATTIAGNALSKARIGKPMSRAKAQELLDGLVDRVVLVNDDPDSLFRVESIGVFGSFADPANEEVGDVDVHVVFSHRIEGQEYIDRCLNAADEAALGGRSFPTFLDRLGYLENTFRSEIRGRSPRLDVQFDDARDDPPLPPGVVPRVICRR